MTIVKEGESEGGLHRGLSRPKKGLKALRKGTFRPQRSLEGMQDKKISISGIFFWSAISENEISDDEARRNQTSHDLFGVYELVISLFIIMT